MCLQCVVDSKRVFEDEFLPGYALHIAQGGPNAHYETEEWPVGYYGLIRCNDPDFVFPAPIQGQEIPSYMQLIDDNLYGHCREGYLLFEAAKEAGYDPEKDGWRIAYWLAERIYTKLGWAVPEDPEDD